MNKAVLPLVIIIVLIFATMIQGTEVARANPTYPPSPPTPDLNQPTITIQTPEQNKTYNVNSVPYSIIVNKPSSWFDEYPVHGQILVIDYILDGSQHVEIGDEPDYYKQGPFSFKGTISGLSEGNHSLEVYVRSDSFYDPSNTTTQPPYPPPRDYYLDTYSDKINFTVDTTSPTISFLSGENLTYPSTEVPLNFAVSEPTSKIAYSLDEGDNVTITGNFTLTNLSNGLHNVTVFAWDLGGNVGVSETMIFTVDKQPESTSQPKPFPWLLVAAVTVVVAVMVAVAAVVYLKKRELPRTDFVKNP